LHTFTFGDSIIVLILRTLLLYVVLFFISKNSLAQRTVNNSSQLWGGYIHSLRLNNNYSVWNDLHYVPESFFILRHGFTYHASKEVSVTAGYAWLQTAVASQNNRLQRFEHRPWAQLMVNLPVGVKYSIHHRVRYDYRIRERMEAGLPQDDFIGYHRVRFMTSIRRPLKGNTLGNKVPYLNLGNEILVNFGRPINTDHFDQNRIWLMVGMQYDIFNVQLGYMNRYTSTSNPLVYNNFHTIVLWITHAAKRKKNPAVDRQDLLHREP
jgi:hypothetical protein